MPPESDSELRELYANFFRVGYNSQEFLLDFGRKFEQEEERFGQRIITSPGNAKLLSDLLQRSVSDYEVRFGKISEGEEP
ncbi:MAG TPA: DUF3467 domain-containing protein [Bryobacteraceae bacterium]